MTKIKGTALKSIPLFIKDKFGEEGFKKWLEVLSPEAKEIYSEDILPGAWFPIQTVIVEPTHELAKMFYDGNIKDCAMDSGRFSADYALKGIYKIFVKVTSVHFLIKKGSSIFSTFFDTATIEIVEEQDKKMVSHIKNFPDINEIIEFRIMGWMEVGMKLGGCKTVDVSRTKSITNGDDYTEFVFEWNNDA